MHTNRLIDESSPYLLQHAHNPVDWYPYGSEAIDLAQSQNKPILISIGYSSCHWCHVMEHESFENEEIADYMNKHFICIKVDREEMPDVDHAYMDAIQQIHGNGGWPLNCFALPDGRPFWGGTYFQPFKWLQLLQNVINLFENKFTDLELQTEAISAGIKQQNLALIVETDDILELDFTQLIKSIGHKIDKEKGGTLGAPKFPMPALLTFILTHAINNQDTQAMSWVEISLKKMGNGGIFDQVGGGFSRYSVDTDWKAPHFEKMLYDNAQLISLYANTYNHTKNDFYKEITEHTLEFLKRELLSSDGLYYSALDADSEGIEGYFYTWSKQEFAEVTGHYVDLIGEYYGVDTHGLWEHDRNILLRNENEALFAQQHCLSLEELKSLISYCRKQLLNRRSQRVRPMLDDKSLTGWNSLMILALTDCYLAFTNQTYFEEAIELAENLFKKMTSPEGFLMRTYKNNNAKIHAFLDDYAITCKALLKIYTFSADEKWLIKCQELIKYIIANFYDSDSGFFWFSAADYSKVYSRKIEIYDGVIPSGNAIMAEVLLHFGKISSSKTHIQMADYMLRGMVQHVTNNPIAYSAWANVALKKSKHKYLVAVCGENCCEVILQLHHANIQNAILCGSKTTSELPYFKNRFEEGKTLTYICTDNSCTPPFEIIEDAINYLKG